MVGWWPMSTVEHTEPVTWKPAIPWLTAAAVFAAFGAAPAIALAAGGAAALILGNKARAKTGLSARWLLQGSVVLLGFGVRPGLLWKVGAGSAVLTLFTVSAVMGLGWLLGRFYRVDRKVSLLVSAGTAICGGSAIAALAPAIEAGLGETGVAMAVVFLLNGVALFVFPPIGHALGLSAHSFGVWSALAIHDTSSVVGAAAAFGHGALPIATTMKLVRALWIIPLSLIAGRMGTGKKKAKFPMFLLFFIGASILSGVLPSFASAWGVLSLTGQRLLSGTLFLIGAGLGREDFKLLRGTVFRQAVTLWLIVASVTLVGIHFFG
ncbi:hypothetical protein GALL_224410 [mine drainage metagenome]|uniref:Sulfate exporter family transporter n=1 Tax=mine drainage metagenome TaxID=410659 RepID=A0A1J5RIG5_9ZZZZ